MPWAQIPLHRATNTSAAAGCLHRALHRGLPRAPSCVCRPPLSHNTVTAQSFVKWQICVSFSRPHSSAGFQKTKHAKVNWPKSMQQKFKRDGYVTFDDDDDGFNSIQICHHIKMVINLTRTKWCYSITKPQIVLENKILSNHQRVLLKWTAFLANIVNEKWHVQDEMEKQIYSHCLSLYMQ